MAVDLIPDQPITVWQFDDIVIPFTMSAVGDISSWTFAFIVFDSNSNLVTKVDTAGGGITITSAGSVSTSGTIDVSLVDKLEKAAGNYHYELRRTNAGDERVLAWGRFALRESARDAA